MSDVAYAPDPSSAGADTAASKDIAGVTSKIADAKRAEVASTDKIYGDLSSKIDRAIPRIEQLSKNAGVEADRLKPWNEEAESAKRKTDPITAFGSLGSVVGILASAFTHAPMENALNASAAAMQAIKAGDDKEYERAYKAHEDNLKMYLERHKIEHETYQDAVALLKTNMEAGSMKLKIAAARFGDQKMLAMLDAGMDKEVIDVINAKQKMSLDLAEQLPKIQLANAQMSQLFALGYDPKNPTSDKSQQALTEFQKRQADLKRQEHAYSTNPAKLLLDRYIAENPDASADDIAAFLRNSKAPSDVKIHADEKKQAEIARHNKALEDIQNGRGDVVKLREQETERHDKVMESLGEKKAAGGGAASLTTERQRAQDVAAFRQKLRAEENNDGSPKWSAEEIAHKAAEYERKLKTEAAAPTGNRMDDLQSKIDRVSHGENIFDEIDGLLLKHNAIAGIGGMLTRPAEVVSNILGGNQTDREEFKRLVETLRLEAPRILLDTQGRPISAEAERVNTIIAGLSPGDTSANTIRAYIELRRQFKEIKNDLEKRRGGASSSGSVPKTNNQPWLNDPVVQ